MDPPTQTPSTSDSAGQQSSGTTPSAPSATLSGAAAVATPAPAPAKRIRVLLSCAPCRLSKLKCDRAEPCGQCLKKGRIDGCLYAPKPQKAKPAKSMAARLKRLEGMVRGMMDGEIPKDDGSEGRDSLSQQPGKVVLGGGSATYVGATHFMAMLDDIEDLKGFFEEEDEPADEAADGEGFSPGAFMLNPGTPKSREDILALIPDRQTVDGLVNRYFLANSPSQHIVHRPSFLRRYIEFWNDPDSVPLEWIALLLLVIALATFFTTFMAPHELPKEPQISPMEQFRYYRSAAGWALVHSKYTNPGLWTLPPMILYVEGEFLLNRASQVPSYLLSSICIRLMLKMGLHRDPSKLPNITPFDGELRRRMWGMATQIDLLVSFHMGLPSMIHGIESDTAPPRNLLDEDLDEGCAKLPPARPDSEYTSLTYPIWKGDICRVFGLVAKQAHSLTPPTHPEVMRLDAMLEDIWSRVPAVLRIKPLAESIADPPNMINQRFGLAALYQKSRCVLHRRYLVEAVPNREHAGSRRKCIDASLALLDYQDTTYRATLPGGILRQNGWFLTPLAVHDFLTAAMIVFLVIQSEYYPDVGGTFEWMEPAGGDALPSKQKLRRLLERSRGIWAAVSQEAPGMRKAFTIVDTMFKRLRPGDDDDDDVPGESPSNGPTPASAHTSARGQAVSDEAAVLPQTWGLSLADPPQIASPIVPDPTQPAQVAFSRNGLMPAPTGESTQWLDMGPASNMMDWESFDQAVMSNPGVSSDVVDQWLQQQSTSLMAEPDFSSGGFWGLDNS